MKKNIRYCAHFLCTIIVLLSISLHAQEKTLDRSVPKSSEKPIPATALKAPELEHEFETDTPPKEKTINNGNDIQFNFQDSKLQNLVDWMAQVHGITFLTDDAIKTDKTRPLIGQTKISFQTHKPLSKKQSWNLFIAFLDMAGLTVIPGPEPDFYKITTQKKALTAALPTYIGTDPAKLPDNDAFIRYVYFLQNTSKSMLGDLTKLLKTFMVAPQNAKLSTFAEITALIFTEKSANIKSIMKIVEQLDKATSPEILRMIPLKHTKAAEVVQLYNALAKADDPSKRPFPGPRKEPTLFYFPEDAKLVAENRTNTLIVLGPKKAVDRIEEFVKVHVDKQLPPPDQMLQVAPLQHANASQIAKILNTVTSPKSVAMQQYGTIIGGQKSLTKMIFTADESTNSIVARASKDDWRYIKPIITKLDTMQPQVAIEVLIVTVTSIKDKQLGIQFRNKDNLLVGSKLDFQTSGLPDSGSGKAPLINPTTGSLMANLIGLATGHQTGTTLLTFGQPSNIWGILKILETHTQLNVISSPYLLTTNKYQASVSLGTTKQVTTGTVVSGSGTNLDTKGDLPANLEVKITPQITPDNTIITLSIDINIEDFTSTDPDNTQRIKRSVVTTATLLDREVLALGGLIQKKVNNTQSNVPVLGKIPLLGWFFKNKTKRQETENLLIFISPRIIKPTDVLAKTYTDNKATYARNVIQQITNETDKRDPIHRWFFDADKVQDSEQALNAFMNKENIGMTEPEKIPLFAVTEAKPVEKKANLIKKSPLILSEAERNRRTKPIDSKRRSLASFMKEAA